jgi:hypothetical protein
MRSLVIEQHVFDDCARGRTRLDAILFLSSSVMNSGATSFEIPNTYRKASAGWPSVRADAMHGAGAVSRAAKRPKGILDTAAIEIAAVLLEILFVVREYAWRSFKHASVVQNDNPSTRPTCSRLSVPSR